MKSTTTSAVLALAIVLGGGVFYRVVSARYARQLASTPIEVGTLEHLPLNLGGWTGKPHPLDAALIAATDTDDHVCRDYYSPGQMPGVILFVGYGINLRDLMPHRPEVCYVSQGWTLLSRDDITVRLPGGEQLPCQLMLFRRGELSTTRRVVIHYYIVDGRFGADVSWLRNKTARSTTRARYAARVQIDCEAPDTPDGLELALQAVQRFVVVSAEPIRKLMPEEPETNPANTGEPPRATPGSPRGTADAPRGGGNLPRAAGFSPRGATNSIEPRSTPKTPQPHDPQATRDRSSAAPPTAGDSSP